MRYKESNKKTFLLSSAVIFSLGVLSNYSIFMFIVYFVLLHYYFSKDVKILIKEVYIVSFILILMFMIQLQLGAGGHVDMIKNDPIRFLTPNYVTALKLITTQFDYDFVGTTLFFFSLLYMLFSKKKKMILLLIPYLLNLFFISTFFFSFLNFSSFS